MSIVFVKYKNGKFEKASWNEVYNIIKGKIEGVPVGKLITDEERIKTYNLLVKSNKALPLKTTEEINEIIKKHFFHFFTIIILKKVYQ